MSDTVIKIEHVTKRYRLGTISHGMLYRDMQSWWARFRGKEDPNAKINFSGRSISNDYILALDDISLEVKRGDIVGIIGRNGAGKSTLLKIISRVTAPTKGEVKINGSVASLLEVGTGFHPELTGRENIYINGAIMGMGRKEVNSKFDEIVDFAEVAQFIDTPVKRYSSGMYVRLAFAVAAHLDPEILVVDEVLAVGDIAFQKKCLRKMEEVSGNDGRTILFVSHNMRSILNLCNKGLLISEGKCFAHGDCREIVEKYLQICSPIYEDLSKAISQLPKDPHFCLKNVIVSQKGQIVQNIVLNGDPLEIMISYSVLQDTIGLRIYFELYDNEELLIFRSFHDENRNGIMKTQAGRYISRTEIPANFLAPIGYELRINAGIYNVRQCIPPPGLRIPLVVEATGNYNRAYPADTFQGKVAPALTWSTRKELYV